MLMKCLNWLSPAEVRNGKTEKDIMILTKQMTHTQIIKHQIQKVHLLFERARPAFVLP
jgi:hypothetical protein